MSKAEKYIEENTKLYSNISADRTMTPWLTPDQARKAVEIAREELIEKVGEYIASNMLCYGYTLQTKSKFIKSLKQTMKDE